MIKCFFFHLTYNGWLNHPLISHFLNINNKCIAHVHCWSFSIHLRILLSAHMLHEFKSVKVSMTMRNSYGYNFAIKLWTYPQMQIKTILTHFTCIHLFSKSVCSKESNDTSILKTRQDNWVQVQTSCGHLSVKLFFFKAFIYL